MFGDGLLPIGLWWNYSRMKQDLYVWWKWASKTPHGGLKDVVQLPTIVHYGLLHVLSNKVRPNIICFTKNMKYRCVLVSS